MNDYWLNMDWRKMQSLIERRADLLDATSGLLIGVIQQGRVFSIREQNAWDYANDRIDKLGYDIEQMMSSLERRGYKFH